MKSTESFPLNPVVVQVNWEELSNQLFLWPPPIVQEFVNEDTIDSLLLAALEQFEGQATNRLLLSTLEEYTPKTTV